MWCISYNLIWAILFRVVICDPCETLRNEWQKEFSKRNIKTTIRERALRYNNTDMVVQVWGGGGAPRAAAAVYFVIIHHLLLYRAKLYEDDLDFCWISALQNNQKFPVAPVATYPSTGCGGNKTQVLQMLMSMNVGPGAPYVPTLLAHVPHHTCARDASVWTYYTNDTEIDRCEFLRDEKTYEKPFFKVLARNQTARDNGALFELLKRIHANNLTLTIQSFENDLLFRKEIFHLRDEAASFLFVDEDIWHDDPQIIRVPIPPRVQPSSAFSMDLISDSAVRVGHGIFMEKYAPLIWNTVEKLTIKHEDLRNILKDETYDGNITHAACSWAQKNIERLFNDTNVENHAQHIYDIKIYCCEDDPDLETHRNVTKFVITEINKNLRHVTLRISLLLLNCSDAKKFPEYINVWDAKNELVVSVIAWSSSEGLAVAAESAYSQNLPLFLLGPVTPKLQLNPAVRASTGRVTDLTRAYWHLLKQCGWSRITVLSDSSSYSKDFQDTLLTKDLIYRVKTVVSSHDISFTLESLRIDDARIIFVNSNWNINRNILCTAAMLGMTSDKGYAWIVRDWRDGVTCDGKDNLTMHFYSLSPSWRGGNDTGQLTVWQDKLRENLSIKGKRFTLPVSTVSLVDAIIKFAVGFDTFVQKNSAYLYDFRNSFKAFSEILDGLIVSGVTQNLTDENYSLKDPIMFVEKWNLGKGYKIAALWRITSDSVIQEWPSYLHSSCESLLGSKPVPDRPTCHTLSSGDVFLPRCHDLVITLAPIFLILLLICLYFARRSRLALLNRRYKACEESLIKDRQRSTSMLVTYLVDRNSIKLLHQIGSGSFGRVYFAELRRPEGDTLMVAAKEPRQGAEPAEESEFLREACVLAPLIHENIVRLVGVCIVNGPPMVLMEHALYLDLQRYLIERRQLAVKSRIGNKINNIDAELSDQSLTRLAREAAGALDYLASRRLVHRDIRAANCLVDKERSLKLADFGMARELDKKDPEYATTRRGLFPVLWMAPESLELGIFSHASDVWALGVLILEVATLGARPYGDWSPAQVLRYVTGGGRPLLPPDISTPTRSIVLGCWERQAELRPSAAAVHSALTKNPVAISSALLTPIAPKQRFLESSF